MDQLLMMKSFYNKLKNKDNVLRCFKMIPAYDVGMSLSQITEEHFTENIIGQTAAGKPKNGRRYYPVHIEDDIISVKIYDTEFNVNGYKHFYFVYDLVDIKNETVLEKEQLAFVIERTADPNGDSQEIRNDMENYVQFDLRGLCDEDGQPILRATFINWPKNKVTDFFEYGSVYQQGVEHQHETTDMNSVLPDTDPLINHRQVNAIVTDKVENGTVLKSFDIFGRLNTLDINGRKMMEDGPADFYARQNRALECEDKIIYTVDDAAKESEST